MTEAPFTLPQADFNRAVLGLGERLTMAQDLPGLRAAWLEGRRSPLPLCVTQLAGMEFANCVWTHLECLGLGDQAGDERVVALHRAVGQFGHGRAAGDIVTLDHSPLMAAIYGILASGDPSVNRGIVLRPPQELVAYEPPAFRSKALQYTSSPEYTVTSCHPRKAYRACYDNSGSKFWGFGVQTDDFPGVRRENINLFMPMSLVTQVARAEIGRDDMCDSSGTLTHFSVQQIHLGQRSFGYDTANRLVAEFMEQIHA